MRRAALSALAVLALARPAAAQIPYRGVFAPEMSSLSLQLGRAAPGATGGLADEVGPGAHYSLQYLRLLSDWFGLGAELDVLALGSNLMLSAGDRKVSANALSAFGRLHLLRGESWTPYVAGGAGFHQTSVQTAVPNTGSGTGLAFTAAFGIERFVYHRFGLSLEARFQRLELEPSRFGGLKAAETISALVGVRYWRGTALKAKR